MNTHTLHASGTGANHPPHTPQIATQFARQPPRWDESDHGPTTTPVPESARMLYAYRSVIFNGELRDENGMEIISRLVLLSAEDPHTDIVLWINSPGGSVPMMHAIADTIDTLPNDVVTVAFGWAASAGQFVLTLGTKGKRFALPHARILLHQGSAGIGGAAADIELQGGDLRAVRDTVLNRIAEATGQTYDQVYSDSLRDKWFSATEAIDYGFIDRVVDSAADLYLDLEPGKRPSNPNPNPPFFTSQPGGSR